MHTLIKAAVRLVIILMSLQLLTLFANGLANIVDLLIIGVALVGALILYILWRKSDWLVKKLAGDINENELVINTSNLDLINVVMRVIGMFLILISIPKLAGLIAYRGVLANAYTDMLLASNARATASEIKEWITNIGTLLIGLWLALGGAGIVQVFNKIWNYTKNTE
jgi:hypothetical protein